MSTQHDNLDVVRYDWLGVRIGGPGASMHGSWPVLIVAALVVFGCFFAVGLVSAGGGSPKQGSAAAPVARAPVPGKLRGGTPIPAGVPSAIAEPPRRTAPPVRRAQAVRSTAPFVVAGGTRTTTTSAAAPPEAAPTPKAAPTQASTPSSGGETRSSSGSSGSGSSGGGSASGGSTSGGSPGAGSGTGRGGAGGGGGGSFDSSE